MEGGPMQLMTSQWSRDWELFDDAHSGGNIASGLSDDEVVEYLRWMACNRPQKYVTLMTAYSEKRSMRTSAVAV